MVLSAVSVSDLPRLQEWKAKGEMTTVAGVEIFSIVSDNFGLSTSRKPALIVVHGFPTASFDFWKIYPHLEEHFDVFCWDMVGYGFSQKVHRTVSQQIDVLQQALLLRLQQKQHTSSNPNNDKDSKLKAHILSHDLGDTLVQEMLARRGGDDEFCLDIQSIVMLNGGILPKLHRPGGNEPCWFRASDEWFPMFW